ncbi:MAG: HAD-IIIA family hydrolase [Spirochaetia bacterium]|jgi:D-glycero-D-manno-heptose 1,7-bisphosphate phosphatase
MDRDGVLNKSVVVAGKPYPPSNLSELELSSGVENGCRALKSAGFLLIGITNQPDVARGKTDRKIVEEINGFLTDRLGMDSFQVCYHDDHDDCECRKPKPGMILAEAGRRGIDLDASFMIGDRWKDIEAGRRAGCRTVLIHNHYSEANRSSPTYTVNSFEEAVSVILSRKEKA